MNLYKLRKSSLLAGFVLIITFTILPAKADQLEEFAAFFKQANVVSGPELVDCTLSGGSTTSCFRLTVKPVPTNYTPGPWCPGSITSNAEEGGIWLEEGEVNDVDGKFIENLATFYSDSKWQLFDAETGKIFVTDTIEKCAGAAKPNVELEYQQHCVECQLSYLDNEATITYTIPTKPIAASDVSRTGTSGAGVAFNGVRLDGPAPVDAILSNYTLAPFDDCGGHINLNVGYHYHAATECLKDTASVSEQESIIGVAMDGHFIHARLHNDGTLPEGLDQCGGHETEQAAYHYHAGEEGSNAILNCMLGEQGCMSADEGAECNASASNRRGRESRGGPPGGGRGRPDFAAAASKLGVSESELLEALGGPPPNFEEAAQKLGVSVSQLQEALGRP